MYTTTVNNSFNINKTNDYISPQIIEDVEKLFVILSETICFPPFKIYKVFFIRAQSDGNTILAMQAVNIFSNKYSC
jgi:hypothetical protein